PALSERGSEFGRKSRSVENERVVVEMLGRAATLGVGWQPTRQGFCPLSTKRHFASTSHARNCMPTTVPVREPSKRASAQQFEGLLRGRFDGAQKRAHGARTGRSTSRSPTFDAR